MTEKNQIKKDHSIKTGDINYQSKPSINDPKNQLNQKPNKNEESKKQDTYDN